MPTRIDVYFTQIETDPNPLHASKKMFKSYNKVGKVAANKVHIKYKYSLML
jgi:hypothetical protein